MPTQFVRLRLRCALSPGKFNTPFTNLLTGSAPEAAKDAGAEFEFCLFNLDGTLFDISNIASLTLLIMLAGVEQRRVTITRVEDSHGVLNPGCTLEQWQAGTAQHAVVKLLGTELAFAAGTSYTISVFGFTDDVVADPDAFGRSTFSLIDLGITPGTPAAAPGVTYITADVLAGILAGYIQTVNGAGKTIRFTSPDGTHTVTIGAADDGSGLSLETT